MNKRLTKADLLEHLRSTISFSFRGERIAQLPLHAIYYLQKFFGDAIPLDFNVEDQKSYAQDDSGKKRNRKNVPHS